MHEKIKSTFIQDFTTHKGCKNLFKKNVEQQGGPFRRFFLLENFQKKIFLHASYRKSILSLISSIFYNLFNLRWYRLFLCNATTCKQVG